MKFGCSLLTAMLLRTPGLRENAASKTAKAEELLALMHMEQTYGQMISLVMDQMNQATMQQMTAREVTA